MHVAHLRDALNTVNYRWHYGIWTYKVPQKCCKENQATRVTKQAFCVRCSCWPGCCSYKMKAALCSPRSQKNLCSDCNPGAFSPFLSVSVPDHAGWPHGLCKIASYNHWGLIDICCAAVSARGLFPGCLLLFLMELWGGKKKSLWSIRGDSGEGREKLPRRLICLYA